MNIIDILLKLLEFKTTSSNSEELRGIVDFVEDIFKSKEFYIERFRKNEKHSIYISFKETYTPEILFAGHLDVVPADYEEQWIPRIEGDRVFARGAMDMKGTCAVLIKLFLDIKEKGRQGNFALLFTTDEETGSKDGVEYILKEERLTPRFTIIPDGGVDFTAVIEGKGVFHCELSAKGKSAHGSTPWMGENAIDKLIDIYRELREWVLKESEGKNGEHWHPTLNLGVINGGTAVNKIPDHASMQLDFRFPHPYTLSDLEDKIKEIISRYNGVEYRTMSTGPAVYTSPDNDYIKKFAECYKRVLNKNIIFGKEHGATDGRFFSEKNIPVLTIYPLGAGVHSKDEWVSISSLNTLLALFREFLKEYEES